MIGIGIFAGFLTFSAIQDLRKKRVAVWIYMLFGGLALLWAGCRIVRARETYVILDHLASILIGIVILLAGIWSDGAVGSGDGWF